MPISRGQTPRQLYGLGSFVKSIGKGIKKAVKGVTKVAKSPLGMAAISLAFPQVRAGLGSFFGTGSFNPLKALITKGPQTGMFGPSAFANFLGTGLGKTAAITGASAIGGMLTAKAQEDVEALRQSGDRGLLQGYLRRYYGNLNPNASAEEIEEFVRTNSAEGGRIGLQEGGGIEQRLEQLGGDVSSAEQMLQAINKRLETAESSLGSGGGISGLIPGQPIGTPGAIGPSIPNNQMPPGFGTRPLLASLVEKLDRPLEPLKSVQPGDPGYRAPGPTTLNGVVIDNPNINNAFPSVEEAFANAQKEAQESRKGGFLGQVVLPGEMSFEDFSNMFTPSNNFGQPMQLPTSRGIGGGMQSPLQQAMGFSNGGRIGYAMGDSAEQNAMQASGIMGLPLNENPAGVTELDLRESGGFIPPVGVKEKADDIPAMLSNNEFVFTADAVRGMGDGNVNVGAQRMYDMMKKLENGGRV